MKSAHLACQSTVGAGIIATLLSGAVRPNSSIWAVSLPNDDKTIVHVLNRIGFGPRAGDVQSVRATGVQAYIDQQLHPERIPDGATESRLAGLTTLGLSSREIAQ